METARLVHAFVTGPWQSIMLYASSERPVNKLFLVAPRTSDKFKLVTSTISTNLFGATVRDLSPAFENDLVGLNYKSLESQFSAELRVDPDEVWISSALNWREVMLARMTCPRLLWLYEDGMQSICKFPQEGAGAGQRFFRRLTSLPLFVARYNLVRQPLNALRLRRDRAWSKRVGRRARHFAESLADESSGFAERLRTAISLADEAVSSAGLAVSSNSNPPMVKDNGCILLAQCFARLGMMTEDKEIELYADVVRELWQKGLQVFWKEHPRTGGRYFDLLRAKLPQHGAFSNFPGIPEVPLEISLSNGAWNGIPLVGVVSSSLLYCSKLLNQKVFTCSGQFRAHLDPTHQRMADWFSQRVPAIAQLNKYEQ